MTIVVNETDDRSRLTIPGHPRQRFIIRENSDGSYLLEPAVVVGRAQYEYDHNPEQRAMLREAAASPTVTRTFARRP